MTKKEAFRILRITNDIKYTYQDGNINFMTIIDTYKAQAEADMAVGTYSVTQAQIDDFVTGYYEEGREFGDGKLYSLPLLNIFLVVE